MKKASTENWKIKQILWKRNTCNEIVKKYVYKYIIWDKNTHVKTRKKIHHQQN